MQIARESVFVASLRSFFRCFFAVFGIFFGIIAASILYSMLGGAAKVYEEKTEFSILPDLKGEHSLLSTSTPAILQINIEGVIGEPMGVNTDDIKNILLDSRSGLLSNGRVKGILLNLNTPGGGAIESDNIYRLIKAYKEKFQIPVFGFVNGLCASGGMYIAASADQVFASPPSVIGSIGVIMGPFFNVTEAMGKIGVASKTLSAGLDKDMMNPFRTWKPDEDESLKNILNSLYAQFVDILTQNRTKIDKTKLLSEYGAQVFDSVKAQEIGYIDMANASYDQAVGALLAAAKIDPEKPYQVVELKPKHDWLSALMNNQSALFTGKIEHHIRFPNQPSSQLKEPFAYLYEPGQPHH
jgi:Periplasmic serine proteases (ClpP class)